LDIVYGNYVSFFAQEVNGTTSVKFVADGYFATPRTLMIVVGKDSKLRKAADLAGKRVAVTAANGLTGLIVRSVLDANGGTTVPPSFVEMAYSDMGAALQSHTVDAALQAEPYITDVARKSGAYPLIDAASGPTADIPVSGYAATDGFIARYPNTVAAFQRALGRGASIAGNDRAQVERVVHEYAGVDEQTAALMALVGYPIRMDPQRLQRIPDLMTRFGLLGSRIDARTMILPSAMTIGTHP
jgi:NitT/TauT family transport system substrate-binding protein